MMTVLIPTDFTPGSLKIAETLLQHYEDEECFRIIFTHLFLLPDDIPSLMLSTYRSREQAFIPEEFRQGCAALRSQFRKKLKQTDVRFFYGNTLILFKNFLHANEIDAVAYSEKYGVKPLSRSSIDAVSIIKKSGCMLINTDLLPAYSHH